ncbi:MAG: DUF1214 domain-containing protein [Actinomycetota bacterium]
MSDNSDRARAAADYTYALGVQAVIYGWAPVMMDVACELQTSVSAPCSNGQAPLNRFGPITRLWDWRDRSYTTPNNDTLYLQAWLDIAERPIILYVPPITDRYWIEQAVDMYTESVVDLCNATLGGRGGYFAFALDGSELDLPADVPVYTSPTRYVWLAGRLGVADSHDLGQALEVQRQFRLMTPDEYPNGGVQPEPIRVDEAPTVVFPRGLDWFDRLSSVLAANPLPADEPIVGQFRSIGVGADIDLDEHTSRALEAAFADGVRIIRDAAMFSSTAVNGWNWEFNAGRYGTDYLARASINMNSIGLNVPERAMYPKRYVDDRGDQLTGARRYSLTVDDPMPVNSDLGGFWSLTMYDAADRYMVENEIDRHKVGSTTDGLVRNDDGSITIHLGRDRPSEPDAAANWLPAPDGDFMLQMRLYEPEAHVVRGEYELPQVIRL